MDGPVACLALINTARLERKQKRPKQFVAASAFCFYPGGDLRSHTVARAVSSALRGLTSVFGMGTGVSPAV